MAWNLPQTPHDVFARNTLATVVAQIRFHPVLAIPGGAAAFQARIRDRFPGYEDLANQMVNLQPGSFELREERLHVFRAGDGSVIVSLGDSALAVERKQHTHRADLFRDFEMALRHTVELFGALATTRIGLRYINIIDREAIATALGRKLEWQDLVDPSFLKLPKDLANLDDTRFASEVTSSRPKGAMTLRYGLLADRKDQHVRFRFDVDRYLDGTFPVDEVPKLLSEFSDDNYNLFRAVMGPALKEWMEAKTNA